MNGHGHGHAMCLLKVDFQLVVGAVHSVPAQVTAVAADRPSPLRPIPVLQPLTEGMGLDFDGLKGI